MIEILKSSSSINRILKIIKKLINNGIIKAINGGKLFIFFKREKIVTGKICPESKYKINFIGWNKFFNKFVSVI